MIYYIILHYNDIKIISLSKIIEKVFCDYVNL